MNTKLFAICLILTFLFISQSGGQYFDENFDFDDSDDVSGEYQRYKRHFAYKCNIKQCNERCIKVVKKGKGFCAPDGKCICRRNKKY